MEKNNILIDYPKNNNIRFLFSSYPAQKLFERETIQKELRLPSEPASQVFIAAETDISDLAESLQEIIKTNLSFNDEDTLVYRVFNNSIKNFQPENDPDIYNLVYADFDWHKTSKNNKMN